MDLSESDLSFDPARGMSASQAFAWSMLKVHLDLLNRNYGSGLRSSGASFADPLISRRTLVLELCAMARDFTEVCDLMRHVPDLPDRLSAATSVISALPHAERKRITDEIVDRGGDRLSPLHAYATWLEAICASPHFAVFRAVEGPARD
jgi:hypothetical protein